MKEQKIFRRYSTAFKQKVVTEIEKGKLTINEAKQVYDIRGDGTIQIWLRKFGKTHLLNKVIHIEMKDEPKRIKELERQKKQLESALAQAHLKIITLESSLKVLEEKTGVELKKRQTENHRIQHQGQKIQRRKIHSRGGLLNAGNKPTGLL